MTKEELFKKFLLETNNTKAFENFEAKEKYIGKKFYILKTSKQHSCEITITKAVYDVFFKAIRIGFTHEHATYEYNINQIDVKGIFSTEAKALEYGIKELERLNKNYVRYLKENTAQIKAIKSYLAMKRGK